jgi:ribonuclease G
MTKLLLAFSPGEVWAALVAQGDLSALRLVRTDGAAKPGDLYLGRVVALRPALPAVLVDIGEARPAFLGGEAIGRGTRLREGEVVTVKVIKAARADKATGLTMKLDREEQKVRSAGTPPKLIRRRETVVASLIREFRADEIAIDDAASLAEVKRNFAGEVKVHLGQKPLFEAEGVAAIIESAVAPRVALPRDGAISIDMTWAAILIDVDGGRAGALSANLAAAAEIARQIRLRDLSGPIVIDFVGMRERNERGQVETALTRVLDDDVQCLGWTRLGHFELVVKRRRPSLSEQLYERRIDAFAIRTPLTVALEALRVLQRESRAAPGNRLGLRVHPEIAACLDHEAAAARRELETRLGYAIKVDAEPRARDSFALVPVHPISSPS